MTAKLSTIALTTLVVFACTSQARAVVFDDNVFFRPGDATWSLSHNPGTPDFYVAPPAIAPVSSGPAAFGVANSSDIPMLGDVDGNGLDDLVILRPGVQNFSWFAAHTADTNNDDAGELGAGGFSSVGSLGVVAGSEGNFLADFNGDGSDDLITINAGFDWFGLGSTNAGLGGGVFTSTSFGVAGDQPFVGDFNGDGTDDLGLYRVATGDIFTLNNTGGNFGGGGVVIAGPIGAGQDSVLVGRLNNDNFDDLMLLC